MKKIIALALATLMTASLAACAPAPAASVAPSAPPAAESKAEESTPPPADAAKPYIAVVSKGFQHQFWQVVKKGAEQAAADLNVEITFDGPPTESDIAVQVEMLKAAMDKKPAAVCLAALSTDSVMEQLQACLAGGIPVVGFDSGVSDAPEGSIYATAATDNVAAGAIAAQNLFDDANFKTKLATGTAAKPVHIGVLPQDVTSESLVGRTQGFIDKMVELAGAATTKVQGHDKYKVDCAAPTLIIDVNVPATTSATDMKAGAESLLIIENLIAIYGPNENGAGGMLAASNDGADFAKDGKYKDIIAVGFDAGQTQRTAVENGWFLGSVTQDPYQIGYKAVALAVDAIAKKPAASPIIDTGAKWYNAESLKDPAISELVYK